MADLVVGVLGVAVPVAIDTIKRLCGLIIQKHQERKERDELITKKKEQDKQLVEGLDESIRKLSFNVRLFNSLRQSATYKEDQHEGSPLQIWLEELQKTLSDAEDLLDEYATDIAIREIEEEDKRGTAVDASHVHASSITEGSLPAKSPVTKENLMAKVRRALFSCSYSRTSSSSAIDINEAIDSSSDVDRVQVFASEIGRINVVLDALSEKRVQLGLQVVSIESKMDWGWRETSPSPMIDPMVGRKDDTSKIKQAILQGCGLDNEGKVIERAQRGTLAIVPIVGIGGMGKTTLAQTIFNVDELKQLDWRVWVCVSDDFKASSILQKTITSIYCLQERNEECRWSTLADLERGLVKLVQGKRILLVLDDIWEERESEWEPLMKILDAAARSMEGFAVLITTRIVGIKEAIRHPGCMEPVHLKGLEEEEIWQVFKKYAFRDSGDLDRSLRDSLEVIGKKIVEKMKGSPLAAKSIGALLYSHHSKVHWDSVADSELWELKEQDKDDIIPILRLSYEYLPTDLKQCLVFFSLYPKDYEFCEYELIHLWMAHNLLIQSEETEEVGKRNLRKLASRSFLEQGRSKECKKHRLLTADDYVWTSDIGTQCDGKRYLMHDLIHDLLQLVSKHHCHLIHDGNTEKQILPGVQHVSAMLSRSYDRKEREQIVQCVYEHIKKHDKLRTLMISGVDCDDNIVEHITAKMTCLRVLALKSRSGNFVQSICNLKHLRVLELPTRSLSIRTLPESIWHLQNLQVLDVMQPHRDSLSSTFTRLVNLRYLCPYPAVAGIGKLTLLRTFLKFSVQEEKSGFGIGELKDLNKLRRYLIIENLDFVRSREEAEQACLSGKKHVEVLKLNWRHRWQNNQNPLPLSIDRMIAAADEVLEGLKPYGGLKQIYIKNYPGVKAPSWLNDSWLSSLTHIRLCDCESLETLPPSLATMPHLKDLHLETITRLKEMRWKKQFYNSSSPVVMFPALEDLTLINLPEWVGWRADDTAAVNVVSVLPQLKKLFINWCPKLNYFAVKVPATAHCLFVSGGVKRIMDSKERMLFLSLGFPEIGT